jgi:hypothetical protein
MHRGLSITISVLFCLLMIMIVCAHRGHSSPADPRGKFLEILFEMNDISAANLINSLYLTADQAKSLKSLALESNREKTDFRKEIDSFYPEALKTLRMMKRELTTARELKNPTRDRVAELEKKFQAISRPHQKKMKALAMKARAVLTGNQYILLSEFKPCLIIPRERADPERVGQVQEISLFEKILVRIRSLPCGHYSQKEASYVDRIISLKERLHLDMGDEKKEKARIRKTLQSARDMKDPEFELRKNSLALELAHSRQRGRLNDDEAQKRIEEYLLDPSVIPLYDLCARENSR